MDPSTAPVTTAAATCFPTFVYDDARAAIDLLERAFGLTPIEVIEDEAGDIVHAELRWGNGVIMVGSSREAWATSLGVRAGGHTVCLVVEDPDRHHDRAAAAGVEIVVGLADTDYGARHYAARDGEGNVWTFSTYQPLTPGLA